MKIIMPNTKTPNNNYNQLLFKVCTPLFVEYALKCMFNNKSCTCFLLCKKGSITLNDLKNIVKCNNQ